MIRTWWGWVLVVPALGAWTGSLGACGSPHSESVAYPAGSAQVPLWPVVIPLHEGVELVPLTCAEDAVDRCDGVDRDCDGQVDEGCGYGSDEVAVFATWNSDADLRLEIEGSHTRTHDGRGACEEGELSRIESLAVPEPTAGSPRTITVSHLDACGGDPQASTTVSITVAVFGRVAGPFNTVIAPGEEEQVLTLQLHPPEPLHTN